jgi:uncharacterized protein YaiE (UPF0345 family)
MLGDFEDEAPCGCSELRPRAPLHDGNSPRPPTTGATPCYAARMQFESVTAVAKANVYFDGKVVSHTILLADGKKKTLGLIYPGEFHFGTDAAERMDIVAGSCRVRLDGTNEWREYGAGTFFRVPAKSGFDVAVASGIAEYVCSFE